MKRAIFLLFFLALALSSYAQNISNRFIFIEGTSDDEEQRDYFMRNFTIEAKTAGYTVTDRKRNAAYSFIFSVLPNTIEVQGVLQEPPPEENQFVLNISLVNNKDNEEKVAFTFYFSTLDEMFEYNQFLFHRATIYIPAATKADLIDRDWQNKWLYVRASFDYPIIFHALQPAGLVGGQAVYEGTFKSPGSLIPLEHRIQPQPGATIGAEFQFLYFMSIEANLKMHLGDTTTYDFFNFAAGAELKFPIKTKYVTYQPYGAFKCNFNVSPIFSEFPPFEVGGGVQIGMRLGSAGTLFLDVSYLHSLSEVIMYNSYGPIAPEPNEIHYERFVIGLALGYKHGFFARR